MTVASALLATTAFMAIPAEQADAAPKVPNVAKLAGPLAKQKLKWETCDFGSDGLNKRFNKPNVKCATVKVPRDWHNPGNGKTWDIRISHAKNQDVTSGRYKGTIFVNPGGPGGEGLPWAPAMQERTPDLVPYYNFIGFDPRGVGQSSKATCEYEWDPASKDPNAELKAAGKACSENEDVRTISTEQTAYDMDLIRHLLKAPKLSYVGYSYGTWLGAWYEKVFGAKYGDKFVLDSAIDATMPTLQGAWELQPIARDRQFRTHLMNWIARNDKTYGLGTNPQAIHERYFKATSNLDPSTIVLTWLYGGGASAFPNNDAYPAAASIVKQLTASGEKEATPKESGNPAADASDLLKQAASSSSGQAKADLQEGVVKLAPLAKLETEAQAAARAPSTMKKGKSSEVFDFVRCNDGQWTQGADFWNKKNAQLAKKAPLSAQWGLVSAPPVCAFWRTNTLMPVADSSFLKTVVVQGELDSQTGWEGGYKTGTKLPNTSFIAIDNEGSHGHFPYGTEAVDRPIYNYFLTGKQPPKIKVTQAKPLPNETTTYESWGKLNKKAKHSQPDFDNPFIPATSAGARNAGASLADLMAGQETEQYKRQVVKEIYGDKGEKVLDKQN